MTDEARPARASSPVAIAASGAALLLIPLQLGVVPYASRQWALGLWRYRPPAAAVVLAGAMLLLCWPAARRALVVGWERLRPNGTAASAAALALCLAAFWLFRERTLLGDSPILLQVAWREQWLLFPEVGATSLFRLANRLALSLPLSNRDLTQAFLCVAGALSLPCFVRVGRALSPPASSGWLAAGVILGGGLARHFFGHIEVYGFVILCTGLYLVAVCEYLERRRGLALPALALGVGIWMHFSFVVLAPGLLALPWLRDGTRSARERVRDGGLCASLGAAPLLLYGLVLWALGAEVGLEEAWGRVLSLAGLRDVPSEIPLLVRPPGTPSGPGTEFSMYSPGHLKYLANALFLLAPASLLVAVAAPRAWRRLAETPMGAFLAIGCACTLVYASLVRPVWGPFDWDLFTITGLHLGALAAFLLGRIPEPQVRRSLGVLVVGVSLAAVTLPFVVAGVSPRPDAGIFAKTWEGRGNTDYVEQITTWIAPWL